MAADELIGEAVRLAIESVENGWGGPFGAVVAKDGEIVARGQNRVLLTGDPTAHAEIEAIRNAMPIANANSPSISQGQHERAPMLLGHELYTVGAPCPMCLGAIYWARLERVYYACGLEATRTIGFADAFFYEDLAKPEEKRTIPSRQIHADLGAQAYDAWLAQPERQLY